MSDQMDSEASAKPMIQSRGGRPRASEPGSAVTTWVPIKTHDLLVKIAMSRGESVSATVRQLLLLRLR